MHAKMEALVVERGNSVADNLVREFEDGFLDQRVRLGQFGARVVAGHLDRRLRFKVQYDPAFDVPGQRDHAGHALAAVGVFFHGEVAHLGRALQPLRQHGVGRVDERLDQFHLHRVRLLLRRRLPRLRLRPART